MLDTLYRRAVVPKAIFAVVLVFGGATVAWAWWASHQPFAGCAIEDLTEGRRLALSQFSDTVKQLLTLSTTLAALGSALLLGLKQGPKLTGARRILILSSVCCFVLSTYFALFWLGRLAEIHWLECPGLVTQPFMKSMFVANTLFFALGLGLMGLIVLSAAFEKVGEDGHEPARK